MNIASYIFGISIVIYREIGYEECEDISFEYINSFNISKKVNEDIPILILCKVSINHYELIFFNENNNKEKYLNLDNFKKFYNYESLNIDNTKNINNIKKETKRISLDDNNNKYINKKIKTSIK